jgi:hypothetical protein
MIGRLVSRTIFSGHLCADLIRMIDLSMTSSWETFAGRAGRHQSAINSKAASVPPTEIK